MRRSIATVSVPGNLREKLEAIAAAGFDGIEIFEQDFIAEAGSPAEIGAMIRDHGLGIEIFQPFRDFEGLVGSRRVKAFDRAERKFDLMQQLGTDLVLVCSSVAPDAIGGIDRAADDFRELGERAAKRGLRVGYEALAWGRHVNDHRDAWEVVRRADHPNVGLILDSFHTLGRKLDPETIRRVPGDRIFFVQLADAPMIEMDLLYWSRHFRNMPGEGDLDVTAFMRAVMATGYRGPVSLEIFNDQFRGGRPETVARDGHRSLVHLLDRVRREEPGVEVGLPPIPDRIAATGVEFIEFATSAAESGDLTRQLAALGFARTRRHRTKSVELWQQGKIRIVVNTETSGFAHSAYVTHGTGICDIGIGVSDAAATMERARALGANPFHQPVGPGETDIPAIRGVGGSVMHFIDDSADLAGVWEREFVAEADVGSGAGGGDTGLTRIDHLGETMAYDEMLSWALFYTSIFDLAKSPMVDVADPDGLVRSQAIEAPEGALRLTLNGAETHRTFAGRFLADSFNSAVQHIAFACDDILATSTALTRVGFAPLPIPSNYYDDLAARFELDPALLARLRAGQIMYDRDAGGEFFQLYSRPTPGGLFFEIVERRGAYAGYGAPNAPFRIAAQKRLVRPKGIPKS